MEIRHPLKPSVVLARGPSGGPLPWKEEAMVYECSISCWTRGMSYWSDPERSNSPTLQALGQVSLGPG